MCGINGLISTGDLNGLEESLQIMRHRGPNATGIWRGKSGGFNVGLGHLRLSIIDLSAAANQPFLAGDGQTILVYNGEIYNYRALREELRKHGCHFSTESDTEVLLQAYLIWGIDCVRRFDGMFAFAVFDGRRNELSIARDPLGIKPLYVWTNDSKRVAFASEIRGIRALAGIPMEPDESTYAEFLLNGWLYEPKTGFKNVEKLMPGEYRTFDLNTGTVRKEMYYCPLQRAAPSRDFVELLNESVELQRVADVKVGLFFSGGLDSSVLAAASGPLEGLFVEYAGDAADASDAAFAHEIAKMLKLPVKTVCHDPISDGPDAILADFRNVAANTEELIADYTYSASSLLSADARASGYTVMLSGMGGDELFAGYPRYKLARYRQLFYGLSPLFKVGAFALRRHPSLEKKIERLLRFSEEGRFIRAYTSLIGYLSEVEVSTLMGKFDACEPFWHWCETMGKRIGHLSHMKQAMYLDRYGFLAHNLMVTDKSSMQQSIEMRVPIMSNELAELGFAMNDAELLSYSEGKKPLRRFLEHSLPARLINRPKIGFNPPLDGKIRALGKDLISDIFRNGPLSEVLDANVACRIVDAHFNNAGNQTYKIWQMLYFNFWLEFQNNMRTGQFTKCNSVIA
ncbi:asparagine synthase (glutamine-hydrolyzing) [Noviherbaspirillum autotrophicum]|uniref:asparagine synthase (glutamine-hydrolyzing) n=1 Tax=Noviherbaspirillum autotrophicum TaxID=709839 RepID=UPI000A04166B|nr:asparagine synthase (glutamine-hydrolyzing) [Noviherbaspirillum autotrophicum]